MYNLVPFIKSSGIACSLFSIRYEEDFGIGDLKGAYRFVDFLQKIDSTLWKFLPIHDVTGIDDYYPFHFASAFALDPLIIDIMNIPDFDHDRYAAFISGKRRDLHEGNAINYGVSRKFKDEVLTIAFDTFYQTDYTNETDRLKEFAAFIKENEYWIEDYSLYKAITVKYGNTYSQWDEMLRKKDKKSLDEFSNENKKEIIKQKYMQWIAHIQWLALKQYANERNISLIGDIPFYVGVECADIWSHPQYFQVDKNLRLNSYAGTPPNSTFSIGEVWQTALFNWKNVAKDNYEWWLNRLTHEAQYFDGFKISYFRGFVKYWKVINGKGSWETGPGEDILNLIAKEFIDKRLKLLYMEVFDKEPQEVEELRQGFGFEGYETFVLDYNSILKHDIKNESVVASSNFNTISLSKWWEGLTQDQKTTIASALHLKNESNGSSELTEEFRWKIIEEMLYESFPIKIFPIQDILGSSEDLDAKLQQAHWHYRVPVSIENLLNDEQLINRLNLYSDLYSINSHFRGFKVRAVPGLYDQIRRIYTVNEEIILWAFVEKEGNVQAITNIPTQEDASDGIKEIPFNKVMDDKRGFLYRLTLKAIKPGEYTITIKTEEDEIRSFENKFEIEIKPEKKSLFKF